MSFKVFYFGERVELPRGYENHFLITTENGEIYATDKEPVYNWRARAWSAQGGKIQLVHSFDAAYRQPEIKDSLRKVSDLKRG